MVTGFSNNLSQEGVSEQCFQKEKGVWYERVIIGFSNDKSDERLRGKFQRREGESTLVLSKYTQSCL